MARSKLLSEPTPDPASLVGEVRKPNFKTEPRSLTEPRRFVMGDFQDMGLWLLGRLRDRWSHINDKMFMGWLRGAMETNEYLFLRTQNAVALAQASHNALSPVPIVEEVFVLSRNNDIAEAAQLYQPMKRWATGLGATELQIERFSDVPHEILRDVIGARIMVRERLFVGLT